MNYQISLVKNICNALEYTDLSAMSDAMNCIDLSHHNLNNQDLLSIIKVIQNKHSNNFDGITSINLSNNIFTSNAVIDELFILFGQKFKNLNMLNLSNSGIAPTMYNDDKLKSLNLSATITWFEYDDEEDSAIHSDDSFDFMDDDDSDDDDESDSVDPILQIQDDEDDIDDFIVDDHRFYDDIVHENRLQIEYSLNLNATDSVLFIR